MKRNPNTIFCMILTTILVLSTLPGLIRADVPTEPHEADAMWVEPSSVTLMHTDVSVGTRFNITVWLNITSDDVFGYQVAMYYNRTYLKATRSDFTAGAGGPSEFMEGHSTQSSGPTIDTSFLGNGSVVAFESCKGEDFIPAPQNGSLIWIEFEILVLPSEGNLTSKFDISTEYPARTWVQNFDLAKISITAYDSTYTIVGPSPPPPPPTGTRIYVDPPEIIDPSMLPSSTFDVNITIDDVGSLKICEFNLTYDSAVLTVIMAKILKVQNQFPTPQITMDDVAGFIWVKLTYQTAVTTEIPIPLITIQFHVDTIGQTPLDLHDTHLTNEAAEPITHEVYDGFFATLIRDIAITNVTVSHNWAFQGWEIDITVTVKNKGNINETFDVSSYYDSNLIGNLTLEDLPSGNETSIIFTWNTESTVPCNNYTISAQISIVPYELNTTDNTYIDGKVKIRLVGDINGDGVVDGADIAIISSAFGSYPGHPRWNPDADINQDNWIDGVDVILTARNFGKSCST